jgi:glycolate oxidase FAD binding subunit
VRATPSVRASANVFGSLNEGLAKVTRSMKEGFDPKGVLNPGRMYAGL